MSYEPRLKKKYHEEIIDALQKEFNYSSSMQVPKIEKICLNQGIGAAVADKKLVEAATTELVQEWTSQLVSVVEQNFVVA